jgi:nucleotide-binding universal stress UspA family protein
MRADTHESTELPWFTILVGMDFSDLSEEALAAAIAQSRGHEGAELHAVTVIDFEAARHKTPDAQAALDQVVAREQQELADALARAGVDGTALRTFVHVRIGSAAKEIVSLAAEIDADLIVVGTHGRKGLQRLWMGSVAEQVLRQATCQVLVVRHKAHPALSEILLEPPCADCVTVRDATHGQTWWCEQHAHRHKRAHTYGYSSQFNSASVKVW